ncbi:MAG: adenine phosphoribosyltransferase [Bacillota bacterium]
MDLAAKLRVIPDFPQPGISFKDITTLLKDAGAFKEAMDRLAGACRELDFDLVVAPEARGFIIGSALAYALGKGFVPVRKAGKLPGDSLVGEYQLEYGQDRLEIHLDAVRPGQRVLVVDDLLATGGTISATLDLVKRLGGEVAGVAFLIELAYLPGRQNLGEYHVITVIRLES